MVALGGKYIGTARASKVSTQFFRGFCNPSTLQSCLSSTVAVTFKEKCSSEHTCAAPLEAPLVAPFVSPMVQVE